MKNEFTIIVPISKAESCSAVSKAIAEELAKAGIELPIKNNISFDLSIYNYCEVYVKDSKRPKKPTKKEKALLTAGLYKNITPNTSINYNIAYDLVKEILFDDDNPILDKNMLLNKGTISQIQDLSFHNYYSADNPRLEINLKIQPDYQNLTVIMHNKEPYFAHVNKKGKQDYLVAPVDSLFGRIIIDCIQLYKKIPDEQLKAYSNNIDHCNEHFNFLGTDW